MGILCIGQTDYAIEYDPVSDKWTQMNFDKNSKFTGSVKYASLCYIKSNNQILVSGGCSLLTNDAVNK